MKWQSVIGVSFCGGFEVACRIRRLEASPKQLPHLLAHPPIIQPIDNLQAVSYLLHMMPPLPEHVLLVQVFRMAPQHYRNHYHAQAKQVVLDIVIRLGALQIQHIQVFLAQKLVLISASREIQAGEDCML